MAVVDPLITHRPATLASVDVRRHANLAFLSDVHLQATDVATFHAWSTYLQHVQADAMFILGDLFEAWVGDDVLGDPKGEFERNCLACIHTLSQRMPVYWMAGNRDFLLGNTACTTAGMQALQDPCVLNTSEGHWLLSHGDALCLADQDYLKFRRMVRTTEWQTGFLSKPLHQRLQEVQNMRALSEAHKARQTVWADVDLPTAVDWLTQHQASVLVHGHTHHAADHDLSPGFKRYVLSDWDATAGPPRLQTFSWQAGRGFLRQSLSTRA